MHTGGHARRNGRLALFVAEPDPAPDRQERLDHFFGAELACGDQLAQAVSRCIQLVVAGPLLRQREPSELAFECSPAVRALTPVAPAT